VQDGEGDLMYAIKFKVEACSSRPARECWVTVRPYNSSLSDYVDVTTLVPANLRTFPCVDSARVFMAEFYPFQAVRTGEYVLVEVEQIVRHVGWRVI
jgi:hypothetical protein